MLELSDLKVGDKILVQSSFNSLYSKYWVEVEITDIDETELQTPIQIFGELWYSLNEIRKFYEPTQTNPITTQKA